MINSPTTPFPIELSETLIEDLRKRFGLPLHLYFKSLFVEAAAAFQAVLEECYPNGRVCFAVKSNPCRGSVRLALREGCGVDAVSEFELQAALEEGAAPDAIVCNGNAKSDRYLRLAVESGVWIAADSLAEIGLIAAESSRYGRKLRLLLRVSGMALDGLTSPDQSTAGSWTKFGVPIEKAVEVFAEAEKRWGVKISGLAAHIGTQICDPSGYERLGTTLLETAERLSDAGYPINAMDFGGGYPLSYLGEEEWRSFDGRLRRQLGGAPKKDWVTFGGFSMGYAYLNGMAPTEADPYRGKAYWSPYPAESMLRHLLTFAPEGQTTVADRLHKLGSPRIFIEPGRALIGRSGVTIAEVTGCKEVEGRQLVNVDLGIVNHGTLLVTPDLFPVKILPELPDDDPIDAFIGGRLCFTGDMISKVQVRLNRTPKRGDLLLIGCTGAYSADHFASNSCGFPRPAKIAIDASGRIEVWRKAEGFNDVF